MFQATLRGSNEDFKVCEISKPTLGPHFEIVWLCDLVTQNPVFQQMAPLDMLSHIYYVWYKNNQNDIKGPIKEMISSTCLCELNSGALLEHQCFITF